MKFILGFIFFVICSGEFSGEATYYDADGSGACGFDSFGTSDTIDVAAINGQQFDKNPEFCGTCAKITKGGI